MSVVINDYGVYLRAYPIYRDGQWTVLNKELKEQKDHHGRFFVSDNAAEKYYKRITAEVDR